MVRGQGTVRDGDFLMSVTTICQKCGLQTAPDKMNGVHCLVCLPVAVIDRTDPTNPVTVGKVTAFNRQESGWLKADIELDSLPTAVTVNDDSGCATVEAAKELIADGRYEFGVKLNAEQRPVAFAVKQPDVKYLMTEEEWSELHASVAEIEKKIPSLVFPLTRSMPITDSLFADIQKLFQIHNPDCSIHFEMDSKGGIIDTGSDLNGYQTNAWDGTVEHRIVIKTTKRT